MSDRKKMLKQDVGEALCVRVDCWPRRLLFRYNRRVYTVFSKLFAVKGNWMERDFDIALDERAYGLTDFDKLTGLYRMGVTGRQVVQASAEQPVDADC